MLRRDLLARVPGRVRLLVAAVLCLTPMGLVWSMGSGYLDPGTIYDGDCGYDDYGSYYCNPTVYVHGTFHPGGFTLVSQSPIRVFLIVAALALTVAAMRGRSVRSETLVKAGVAALVLAAVVAGAHGVTRPMFAIVVALLLSAPLVMRRPV